MQPQVMTLLSGAVANANSAKMRLVDWTNYAFEIFANGTPTGTIKIKVSLQEDVDFSVASSPTNRWVYANLVDADAGSAVAGSTGIVIAGSNTTKIVEVNGSHYRWACAELTGWVAGAFTVIGTASNSARE
jgi:hypothetical protein